MNTIQKTMKLLAFGIKSEWRCLAIGTGSIVLCVLLLNTVFKTPELSELERRDAHIEEISEYTDGRYANYILLRTDTGNYYYRYGERDKFLEGLNRLTELHKNETRITVYVYPYPEVAEALAVNGYERIVEICSGDEILSAIDEFDSYLAARRYIVYLIIGVTVIWLGWYAYATYSDIVSAKG